MFFPRVPSQDAHGEESNWCVGGRSEGAGTDLFGHGAGGVKGSPGCAEAMRGGGGKSNCSQALALSCPPFPPRPSGGALLASAKSSLGIPNASRED